MYLSVGPCSGQTSDACLLILFAVCLGPFTLRHRPFTAKIWCFCPTIKLNSSCLWRRRHWIVQWSFQSFGDIYPNELSDSSKLIFGVVLKCFDPDTWHPVCSMFIIRIKIHCSRFKILRWMWCIHSQTVTIPLFLFICESKCLSLCRVLPTTRQCFQREQMSQLRCSVGDTSTCCTECHGAGFRSHYAHCLTSAATLMDH